MPKLRLESLSVDTFETSRTDHATRGTVWAHAWTRFDPTCGGMSCDYVCITMYDDTCQDVCAA